MTRSRVRERERIRSAVQTSDPAALAAYAALLRPVVANLRALAEDATATPDQRVHSRVYLRREILKGLREIETRIEVASNVTT
jgi:phage-related minor tail protein